MRYDLKTSSSQNLTTGIQKERKIKVDVYFRRNNCSLEMYLPL